MLNNLIINNNIIPIKTLIMFLFQRGSLLDNVEEAQESIEVDSFSIRSIENSRRKSHQSDSLSMRRKSHESDPSSYSKPKKSSFSSSDEELDGVSAVSKRENGIYI